VKRSLIVFGLLTLPLQAQIPRASAQGLFEASRRAEAAGDSLQAYLLAVRASALDPSNETFTLHRGLLQNRLMQTAAATVEAPADDVDRMAQRIAVEGLSPTDVIESQAALPPTRLKGTGGRKSFDLRATSRQLFEQVGEAFGIRMIFEPDYPAGQPMPFRLNDATMEEAFHALEAVTNSFIVPVRATEAEVFRDTPQNRTTYTPAVSIIVPIPERMSIQDAQEIAAIVQQTSEIRRIAVDAGRRVIYMRDQETKVLAARKILADLARLRAKVEVEVELLSATSNVTSSYGMSLPTSVPLVNFSLYLNNRPSPIAGIAGFASFGGGVTHLGLGITNASAFAMVSKATSQSVFSAQAEGLDGQQLTMHIGDRYPVVTGRLGNALGQGTNIPQIAYQDLGLKIQITPAVHNGEISLVIEGEHNQLGAVQSNGIPIISTRKFQGTARLKQDEWAVFAGLTISNAVRETSGLPLLSRIPWAGRAFRQNRDATDNGEILVVLKPRLIGLPAWEVPSEALYVGTETKPLTVF
jgi:general secretion pathway protein D